MIGSAGPLGLAFAPAPVLSGARGLKTPRYVVVPRYVVPFRNPSSIGVQEAKL
jgi:hypothetical protein